MFVAVACDLGNEDLRDVAHSLLLQYGFKRELDHLYESNGISEKQLLRLKRELDQLTDSYDSLRFYQYPMNGTLVITTLKEKKWRKLVIKI